MFGSREEIDEKNDFVSTPRRNVPSDRGYGPYALTVRVIGETLLEGVFLNQIRKTYKYKYIIHNHNSILNQIRHLSSKVGKYPPK
jgi:hypothetical protein